MDFHLPPIEEGYDNEDEDLDWMNLKPKITTDKESVYGWYPPQWNIYSKPNYKQLDGYAKECLYKHWYNAYAGPPGSKAPAPPGMGRPPSSPPKPASAAVRRSTPTFRMTRAQTVNSGAALKRQLKKQEEERRQKEQELLVDTRAASPGPCFYERSPSPTRSQILQSSWRFKPEKDFIKDYVLRPMEGPERYPVPNLKDYGFKYPTPDSSVCGAGEESSRPQSAVSPTRQKVVLKRPVKSATVRRPKFPSVPDVEKFRQELQQSVTPSPLPTPTPVSEPSAPSEASPAPSAATPDTAIPEPEQPTDRSSKLQRIKSAPPTVRSPSVRPETPTPTQGAPPSPEPESRPVTAPLQQKSDDEMTYEELVDKYGWKVQIHGDPLHLKKKIIKERLPYTVTCSVPEVAREPPKVHREVWDTFFLNTIPRKPMSFTVGADWVSEVLHAKRMELQKREGGINYRYKDFAFIY